MELTSILGLIVGIGGIILGNIIEGGQVSSLMQGAAAIIVFLGTLGAVMLSSRRRDFSMGLKLAKEIFVGNRAQNQEKFLQQIVEFARIARRESILAIEPKINSAGDPFMQNVVRSVVDGVDPQTIRTIFDKQIDLYREDLMGGAKVWADAGGFAPTIGIIGAVLGLIHVMGNLSDTSKLGSGIAVAFVATIYGVGSANLIFLPIANRIKRLIHTKVQIREMVLEGGLSILSGLSPHLIEMKLKSFSEND